MDKRIGQRDVELSEEAKAEKRFLFQQKKLSEKRSTIRIDESTGVSFDDNPSESTMKRADWKDLFKGNADAEDKNLHSDEEGFDNESDGKEPNETGGMKRKSRYEITIKILRAKSVHAMPKSQKCPFSHNQKNFLGVARQRQFRGVIFALHFLLRCRIGTAEKKKIQIFLPAVVKFRQIFAL
jgi:hypothetical protein